MSFPFIRQSCSNSDNIKTKLIDQLHRERDLVLLRLLILAVRMFLLSRSSYHVSNFISNFAFAWTLPRFVKDDVNN